MASSYGYSFVLTQKFLTFGLLLLITVGFSNQSILSVSRRIDGDLLVLNKSSGFLCMFGCKKYSSSVSTVSRTASCRCKCSGKPKLLNLVQPTTTFYGKESKCMTNDAIAKDNSCLIKALDGSSSSSLLVLNTNMTAPRELTLENIPEKCIGIKLSKWSYYENNAWSYGKPQNIFSVTFRKHPFTVGKKWILQISNNLPEKINGLLVKVSMHYNMGSGINPFDKPECIMFKVLGAHKVTPSPPSTTPSTTVAASTTASPVTGSSQKQTAEISHPTSTMSTVTILSTPKKPKKEPSKEKDKTLLIAFATGGVTLLIVVLLACVGIFIFIRRQRRKKAKKASIVKACTRPPVPLPATSPPHDYEYVVYPAMDDNLQPSTNSLDNAMYGRGPDNELIIRTPAISMESLISKHTNNSTKSNNSTASAALLAHDYSHLQGKDRDKNDDSISIYQSLIRPRTLSSDHGIYIERPQTPCDVKDSERPTTMQPDEENERPTTYIEPCNDGIPEYMELEPVKSSETTV